MGRPASCPGLGVGVGGGDELVWYGVYGVAWVNMLQYTAWHCVYDVCINVPCWKSWNGLLLEDAAYWTLRPVDTVHSSHVV